VTSLVRTVAEVMVEQFGAFLVVEVWSSRSVEIETPVSTASLRPRFRVIESPAARGHRMTDVLAQAVARVRIGRLRAQVATARSSRCSPPGMPSVLAPELATSIGCIVYGLEVAPVYRDPETGDLYPRILRDLRRRLTVAQRRAFFEFAKSYTTHRPPHFHALGRRAVVKAVWEVDRRLAEEAERFDFLLQVTPVNVEQAWRDFLRRDLQRAPVFHYRPLPAEPVAMKRDLYRAPVERIEDPALAMIFRQKLDDIDRQITMVSDRDTPRFLHESLQLYGGVEDGLWELAQDILSGISPRSRDRGGGKPLVAREFAQRARDELESLREQDPEFRSTVEVRPDVVGLLVSRGRLLVGSATRIPRSRVEALIQHEVGTHMLTYHNGGNQRLRLLRTGLAGYDALQEGLAVLAEYLVGGLSKPRLRLLAARVVAARLMIDGATFIETFRALHEDHGFARRTAFNITVRVYRGGGLTKDAVYLRGLRQILDYLGRGGDLEPLFIGKIAVEHVPVIRELRWRGVLTDPRLRPRYLADPAAQQRLDELRNGVSVKHLHHGRKR
jgi:uncharacterized protein (TIGR02421 family)